MTRKTLLSTIAALGLFLMPYARAEETNDVKKVEDIPLRELTEVMEFAPKDPEKLESWLSDEGKHEEKAFYRSYINQLQEYEDKLNERNKQLGEIQNKLKDINERHIPALKNVSSNLADRVEERITYILTITDKKNDDIGLLRDYVDTLRQADTNAYEKALQTIDSIIEKYRDTIKKLNTDLKNDK